MSKPLKPQMIFEPPERPGTRRWQPQQTFTEEQHWLPDEAPETPAQESLDRALRPPRRRPWLLLGLSLTGTLALWEVGDWLTRLWQQEPLLAGAWSLALGILVLGAARTLVREWRLLRRLKQTEVQQQGAERLRAGQQRGKAITYCETLAQQAGLDQRDSYRSWVSALRDVHSDREVLQLYETRVLADVDRQARREVGRWSAESALLVAVSPLASVDMLLMVWRNLKMVERIAALYGVPLGYLSRIRLLRQLLLNLIYAGASELLADLGPDLLGAELAGKLSTRMAQGIGAGLLTARLGIKTMQLCRPMPFSDTTRPRLRTVRRELIAHLRRRLKEPSAPASVPRG